MSITHILKNKTNLLIFLTLFNPTLFIAQTAHFNWSEWVDNSKVGVQDPRIIFPEDDTYTLYSVEKNGPQIYAQKNIYITKYDADGNVLKSLNFALPKRQLRDADLIKIIEGHDKLYVFSNVASKKDEKNIVYAQVFDSKTFALSEPKELYILPIEKVNNSGFINVQISPDKSQIVLFANMPFEKNEKETVQVVLFDTNLVEISKQVHKLSFDSERSYQETIFVNDTGIVNIVKHSDVLKKDPVTSIITINNGMVIEQTVSKKDFYITDSKVISYNTINYLIGFATDNAKPAISIGGKKDKTFFIYDIENKKLIANKGWSDSILKKTLGKGFVGLKLIDVLREGDNLFLIAEAFTSQSEPKEGTNFEYNYTYNFGPGVVVKLNIQGDVAYQSLIKNSNTFKNEFKRLGSFYPYLNNGKLFLLTTEKEHVLKDKKVVFGNRKIEARAVVLNMFNDRGEISTIPFWNSKVGGEDLIIDFAPTYTKQLSNKSFYIYAYGSKYQAFGKINIE